MTAILDALTVFYMSIVEVLKSVEVLAKAVHEKSKHLDELIAQYNTKIQLVNSFLEKLPTTNEVDELLTDELFINSIKKPQCPSCNKSFDGEFILVPKRKVEVKVDGENTASIRQNEQSTSSPDAHSPYILIKESSTSRGAASNNNMYREKSKKVCSYCKKTGHSRARCFKRLNGEKPTN